VSFPRRQGSCRPVSLARLVALPPLSDRLPTVRVINGVGRLGSQHLRDDEDCEADKQGDHGRRHHAAEEEHEAHRDAELIKPVAAAFRQPLEALEGLCESGLLIWGAGSEWAAVLRPARRSIPSSTAEATLTTL
jgi:hypothetical protein